jgi:uncharacterized protein (DUF1800 family)
MDRRDFLTKAKKTATNKANRVKSSERGVLSGLAPYAGTWSYNEAAHLLKRVCFGAPRNDVEYFLTKSVSDTVDELLTEVAVSPPVRDYVNVEEDGIKYDDLGVPLGSVWVNDNNTTSDPNARGAISRARKDSLLKWWTGCIANSGRSITEKMVLFWHHHFSVQREEIGNSQFLYKHHALLRSHALGNVKKLVREVNIDPAMLIHLNGFLNTKRAPDENYARELQELFTVGKGPDSLYTEDDVIATARVLTGWRVDEENISNRFEPNEHDTGTKNFSSFYNSAIIAGSATGLPEIDALTDMIFNTTESSKFICRKLYTWFVYYNIDEATEANVITPLAALLRTNNYDVKPVLSALFKSEHFFDIGNQACYIKSPFDFLIGLMREFAVTIPPYADYANGYPVFDNIQGQAAALQQDLFQPPDVAGWPSYYQDPMFYELWVNSNSLPKRANFSDKMVEDGLLDVRAFASQLSNPANPNSLVSESVKLLFRYPLSATSQAYVKKKFLNNNTEDDTVWANVWNNGGAVAVTDALKKMYAFLLNLPEFHLC